MSDVSWSYSSYSSALLCLRKYRYAYIDKIVAEGPQSGDLVFGSALHSAINAVLTKEDGPGTFQVYWSSYKQKELEYGRFKWAELSALGTEFLRKFEKLHAGRYTLEFAETRLYGEYKGVRLEGTLDFLGTYSGKKSLRDFKTSGYNYDKHKADCALQLYLYAYLAITNGLSKPETLGYTVFNKGTGSIQDLTWEFNESTMYEALDDLVEYSKRVESSSEMPRNLNSCLSYNRKCEYWDKCHSKTKELNND